MTAWFRRAIDRYAVAAFAALTLAIALFFYREHLYVWWLVLKDWVGTLYGLPWPADDESMNALAYLVRGDVQVRQVLDFALDLAYAAFVALFAICLIEAVGRAVQRRLKVSR